MTETLNQIPRSERLWSRRALALFVLAFPVLEGFSNAVLAVGSIGLGALVVGIWIIEANWRRRRVRRDVGLALLWVLTFWAGLSTVWSIDPEASMDRFIRMILVTVLYWMVLDSLTSIDDIMLVAGAFIIGVGLIAMSAVNNLAQGQSYEGIYDRYSAAGFDPNNFGIMAASTIPLLFCLVVHRATWWKLGAVAYSSALVAVILATGSRGALVAIVVALASYFSQYLNPKRLLHWVIPAFAMGALLVYGATLIPERSIERAAQILSGGVMSDRTDIWQVAWEWSKERPFVGFGAGSAYELMGILAHNTFVSAMLEMGVVGLALWALLWIRQLKLLLVKRHVGRMNDVRVALLSALLTTLIGALVLNWEIRKHVYIFWGLGSVWLLIGNKITKSKVNGAQTNGSSVGGMHR